jgi:hypothetical protein
MSEDEEWVPVSKHELMSVIEREWSQLMNTVSKLEKANLMMTRRNVRCCCGLQEIPAIILRNIARRLKNCCSVLYCFY